ncbi:phage SPO1 DNA polymerase-related protein [Leadbetterella byssophila DSM 17132]|jgi:hypothetical protein|uniref:Phage SPO1 DNA polymerase-related protein n=1 Tax=Leadbetterella byssophila (strain DSM 17132 / JCM 16389 / KACC 11308 / NBRC 106382 / 4M15) TaxID=649349 RepID=E4RX65_LEAB4|nr:phage SPO1 DNA polymerase-related protein [Leadbetterella byssophila DSM 17132]
MKLVLALTLLIASPEAPSTDLMKESHFTVMAKKKKKNGIFKRIFKKKCKCPKVR